MRLEPRVETVFCREGPVAADTVAVAVSLCNYARHLPQCLDSVAAQTHPSLELVVVDDASDRDDSLAVARDWLAGRAERFTRALLVRHPVNQGLAGARNTGFARSRAGAVFVLDADNALFPPAIAKLSRALAFSGRAAAYCQLALFDQARGLGLADLWLPAFFEIGNYVDAMALIRRDAFDRVGGYSDLCGWEDYDFWCKCVEAGLSAAFVPEVLCRYRVHDDSMLRTASRQAYPELHPAMMLRHPWLRLLP